jgi:exodeoxyribonuclease VII large subunit
LSDAATVLNGLARGLGDHAARIEQEQQRLDFATQTVEAHLRRRLERLAERVDRRLPTPYEILARTEGRLASTASGLRPGTIERRIDQGGRDLARLSRAAVDAVGRRLKLETDRLKALERVLEANSFVRVLDRGFVLVRDADGAPVKSAAEAADGQNVILRFRDGERAAVIGSGGGRPRPKSPPAAPPAAPPAQETLF